MMKRLSLFTMLIALLALGAGVIAQDTPECEEGFRLFEHEYLATDPVCVPENPQRVIALDIAALELLFYTEDIEVVGTASWIANEMTAMLPELADQVAAVPDVGYPANLEAVLEAEPDLILAYAAQDGIIDHELGSEIAPIVASTLTIDDWERTTEFWAAALGVEPVFEELLANYDARIEALQVALPMEPGEQEVSLVTANTYGVSIWLNDSPQGKILTDIGFSRPAPQQLEGEAAVEEYGTRQYAIISNETLDLADGEIIFLYSYATTDPEVAAEEDVAITAFQETPLWQQLEGVQNGQAYVMSNAWYRAGTYKLANKVIDDIFAALTDVTPEDVSPAPLMPGELTGDV